MNLVENQPTSTSSIAEPAPLNDDDHYHSDDGNPDEEKLQPMRVNYHPSPSPPPAVPLPQVSPDSSPEPPSPSRNGSNIRLKPKIRPSQGDAVLVSFLGNGNRADVARIAGQEPLPSESDEEDMSLKGATSVDMEVRPAEEIIAAPQFDLAALGALAAGALAQGDVNVEEQEDSVIDPALRELSAETNEAPKSHPIEGRGEGEPMEDIKPTVPAITATLAEGTRRPNTPDLKVKTELLSPKARPVQIDGAVTSTAGELPPILQSPGIVSSDRWVGKLPSITDQLGNLNHVGTPQSPPGRPGPPGFPPMGHGSPPKSPNDTFRRELPSPGRVPGGYGGWRRPSQVDTNYTSGGDYSSSTAETPSTDQSGSTPAMMGIDRMSIDNMTNPQIGGFQCTYPGCNAQPFQTQYLLNSHANVHSSNRPHYCAVKGCPRSEGGKGFKRKNEMIRHGLVHDSPGYVCPFCPDREHKYPRPDNLQRHVRVHHVDKDKDDAQLRDVLSQRPEGPSRGRRRRGGTS